MNPLVQLIKNIVYKGLEKYGRYYSSYRGFVINNEDPESLNRLQLKVPNVYGNNINPYWALPKHCFSGPGYGCQNIPEKREMVWVEFEQGDVRRPIWGYGHFGKPGGNHDIPEALRDIKNRWFKTPGGHLIEFDDATEEIRLTHSDGKATLVIQKDNQFIINGGDNGGLVNIKDLVLEYNKTKTLLAGLIAIINGTPILEPGNGVVSALQVAMKGGIAGKTLGSFDTLEDTKVKH